MNSVRMEGNRAFRQKVDVLLRAINEPGDREDTEFDIYRERLNELVTEIIRDVDSAELMPAESDRETDFISDAGLDYQELERMHPAERRKALRAAGLNPDEFDF